MLPASLDLASLKKAYASGSITPKHLVEEIYRTCENNPDKAIWINRLSLDQLYSYAERVESRGISSQPLYGVPFAIKDNIDLEGVPTTAACPAFTYTPTKSATVVQKLIDLGAIPVGKTNLDQFATGLVGVRSPYGVPRNPFREDIIPGGSSSGSAVAVSAGLVSFSLGTDTAGSGRVPAGLNNIVGLKPTKGALSTQGVVPACRTLDCVSLFTLTCSDAAEIHQLTEAFDLGDEFSRQRTTTSSLPTHPRIGIPAAKDLEFFGDKDAEKLFKESLSRLRLLNAELVEIDFTPFRETAALLYQGPWIAERLAALSQFHAKHADTFYPVTRKIIESANNITATQTFDGIYKLAKLKRLTDAQWQKMDILLVPTAPRPYTLSELELDPITPNTRLGTYTNFVNLLDLSALAVPAGFRSDGIPWGITFIAPAWHESSLLTLGSQWHTLVGGKLGATNNSMAHSTLASAPDLKDKNRVKLAVVGAHLSGLPLNSQLTDLNAKLVWSGETSKNYTLYALPNTTPPKPGLVRVTKDGASIALEVWEMSVEAFGTFVAAVPSPLCIGSVSLATGETVKGFLCEPSALEGAKDITTFGGWRNYLSQQKKS